MGFSTAVCMWLVGFVTHLPGLRAAPVVVGSMLLVVWGVGCVMAGRAAGADRGARAGAASSLVASLVNLLILGALLAEAPAGSGDQALRPNWAALLAGYFGFALVLGAAGGYVGSKLARHETPEDSPEVWLARFSKVALLAALPVIFSGGLVTSAGAGLAVPDWPNSFGSSMFLFPLSRMTGGIYYEHAHRLFGSLIGLTTLTLLVFTLVVDRRGWAKALVAGVFALVCAQGILGGLGVTAASAHAPTTADAVAALPSPADVPADYATRTDTGASRSMRMVHGVLGQVTFGMLCAVAAALSTTWKRRPEEGPGGGADGEVGTDTPLRFFTSALVVTMVVQLALGAAARHFQHTHAVYSHVGFAVFAFIAAALASFRALRHRQHRPMRVLGNGVMHATLLQFALGLAALFLVLPYDGGAREGAALLLATLHQFNGAALIGASFALWAWTRRFTASRA